jgi:hypothetical protein
LDNAETALQWFWIRVLKSMLQISDPLDTLSRLFQQWSWPHIKTSSLMVSRRIHFLVKMGMKKISYFALMNSPSSTDELQNWERGQQKQFRSELHRIKQATYPFTQFVMTGFHSDMETLLASSSNIAPYTVM